jgi:hypothetical protein
MLPMHVDDRAQHSNSAFSRYITRPRALALIFAAVIVFGYLFFGGSNGPLMPNPGPYAGHVGTCSSAQLSVSSVR